MRPTRRNILKVPSNLVALIEEVGHACFGPHWRSSMADALGTTVRTINRWRSGQVDLTEELWAQYDYSNKLSHIIDMHCPRRRRALERQLSEHDKKAEAARTKLGKM